MNFTQLNRLALKSSHFLTENGNVSALNVWFCEADNFVLFMADKIYMIFLLIYWFWRLHYIQKNTKIFQNYYFCQFLQIYY